MNATMPTTSAPVLSICIPTFNRARYLDSLLKELTAQIQNLEFSYEILVGDNASSDATPEVVAQYQQQLNIRLYRRTANIGSAENLSQLYRCAAGKYFLYLADDDLPILSEINNNIKVFECNPEVGAIFAPWHLHDKPSEQDFAIFYELEDDYLIEQHDYSKLLALLLTRHIFPEIYLARRELMTALYFTPNPYAFWAFVHIAEMLGKHAVYFSKTPFYRSVAQYFEDEIRTQAGTEEVKDAWDRYRGGLEYILGKFSASMQPAEKQEWLNAINQFILTRMKVALRIRTAENHHPIDNYFIANRIKGLGSVGDLPAAYDFYRVNAALEYLASLTPFLPELSRLAYFRNAPPRLLPLAQKFPATEFLILENGELPSENVIIVTPPEITLQNSQANRNILFLSEAEIIQKFP